MPELTERQSQLLKAVIEEYTKTAEPVGSKNLVEKRGLNISSATVRNEMAKLAKGGFLKKPHTSAGRVPTTMGLRFYLDSLMEETALPVLKEVALKQRLWQERFESEKLFHEAALALAEATGYLSFITDSSGLLFHAGAVNILEHPEFFDIEVTRAALNLFDHQDLLENLFEKATGEAEIHVLIGEETELPNLSECGVVFAGFSVGKRSGTIGILGPSRMEYTSVFPTIRYFKNLIEEVGQGW